VRYPPGPEREREKERGREAEGEREREKERARERERERARERERERKRGRCYLLFFLLPLFATWLLGLDRRIEAFSLFSTKKLRDEQMSSGHRVAR
jgi:hypothetical protein